MRNPMPHRIESNRDVSPAADTAAMVGADPARRVEHTVEGPTLHDRETEFGRGLASFDRSPTCFGRSSRASARSFGPGRYSFAARIARCCVLVAAFALVAVGCGGEDPIAPVTTPPPTGTGTAPGTTVADGADTATDPKDQSVPGANEIAGATAAPGKNVTVTSMTPKAFGKARCVNPVLVVYYQPGSIVDEKLLVEAKAAAAGVEDVVTLAYTPRDVKQAGDLPGKLGLFATPGVATIGRDGKIENFWTTYVDRALIQRSLSNAEKARRCAGGSVPAAGAAEEASPLENAATVAMGGTIAEPATDPAATTTEAAGTAAGTDLSAAASSAAAGTVTPTM